MARDTNKDSIWDYTFISKDNLTNLLFRSKCQFCGTSLIALHSDKEKKDRSIIGGHLTEDISENVKVCQICGWWIIEKKLNYVPYTTVPDLLKGGETHWAAVGSLRHLDLSDISTPIKEVKNFLIAKYEARKIMHPRLFEETVASVFNNLGYKTKVTTYTADGGIDVILDNGSNEIGVQVKRYKEPIKVEQIRAFVGALVLSGYTKGVFVTTSSFQKGVRSTVEHSKKCGYAIELIDAVKFFDALKITQRKMYNSYEDFISTHPQIKGNMQTISHFSAY